MRFAKTSVVAAVAALVTASLAVAATLVFHEVAPSKFDPGNTKLVQSQWIPGIGCPTNAKTFDGSTSTSFTDGACPTGDPADKDNKGLLLAKTGPTANDAAAVAQLKDIPSPNVNELGYDIRKRDAPGSDVGSHCGAGAPRFDIVTTTGDIFFIGCATGTATASSAGWTRLRWDGSAEAFPQNGGSTATLGSLSVKQIFILFDDGQDQAPDNFGAAVLDNIDLNGKLVGH